MTDRNVHPAQAEREQTDAAERWTTRRPVRRGFTLVEASVVLIIIAVLGGILLVALRSGTSGAQVAAEKQMLNALRLSLEQFVQTNNRLPPLILDQPAVGLPGYASAPFVSIGTLLEPVVWPSSQLADPATTFNSGRRFSVYSLPVYLIGSGNAAVDGIDGPGFTALSKDNPTGFSRRGKKYDPLIEPSKFKTRGGKDRYQSASTNLGVLWDYWSLESTTAVVIRYYRWEPEFFTGSTAPSPDLIGKIRFYNADRKSVV